MLGKARSCGFEVRLRLQRAPAVVALQFWGREQRYVWHCEEAAAGVATFVLGRLLRPPTMAMHQMVCSALLTPLLACPPT